MRFGISLFIQEIVFIVTAFNLYREGLWIQKEKCWCWHPERKNKGLVQLENVHTGKAKALWRDEHRPHLQRRICNTFSENKRFNSRWKIRQLTLLAETQKGVHNGPSQEHLPNLTCPFSYPGPSSVWTTPRQGNWHYYLKIHSLNSHTFQSS